MDEFGWAKNAATEAIEKLIQIEKLQLLSDNESIGNLEEELHENLFENENKLLQNGSKSPTTDYLSTEEDQLNSDTAEVVNITAETVTMGQFSLSDESLYLPSLEDFSVGSSAMHLEYSGGIEVDESENAVLSDCRVREASESRVSSNAEVAELVNNELKVDAKTELLLSEVASTKDSDEGEDEEDSYSLDMTVSISRKDCLSDA
ncbi:hypothetical protein SLA2020_153640 [Shorea laevis]